MGAEEKLKLFFALPLPISISHCKEDLIYVFPEMKLYSRAVSFLGTFVSNFRYSVIAVQLP
jgi:hypothetical protein